MRFQIQTPLPKAIIDSTVEGELLMQILQFREAEGNYHFYAKDDFPTLIEMSEDDVEILSHNLSLSRSSSMSKAADRLDAHYKQMSQLADVCEVDLELVGLDIGTLCLSLCQEFENKIPYIAASWSNDADPNSESYDVPGGNAMFVTKNGINQISTEAWLEEQLVAFGNDEAPAFAGMG